MRDTQMVAGPHKIDESDLAEVADKIVSDSEKASCLSCRLVSGGGIIGAGIYVGYHSTRQPKVGKMVLATISTLLCCLGSCRVLNLPPFTELKINGLPFKIQKNNSNLKISRDQ